MAAGVFSTLGMILVIGGPIVAVYLATTAGMPLAFMLGGSLIGTVITLFAIAVIIDRLDKIVAASKQKQ